MIRYLGLLRSGKLEHVNLKDGKIRCQEGSVGKQSLRTLV